MELVALESKGQIMPDEMKLSFTYGAQNHAVEYYDDSQGGLWLHLESCGNFMCIRGIVRAYGFSKALEITRNEFCQRVTMEELHEAYGLTADEYAAVGERSKNNSFGDNESELIEGFEYQSNSTGTGIVWIDDNERLEPLTVELMKQWEITMHVSMQK